MRELVSWVTVLPGNVVDETAGGEDGRKRDSSEDLQERSPFADSLYFDNLSCNREQKPSNIPSDNPAAYHRHWFSRFLGWWTGFLGCV